MGVKYESWSFMGKKIKIVPSFFFIYFLFFSFIHIYITHFGFIYWTKFHKYSISISEYCFSFSRWDFSKGQLTGKFWIWIFPSLGLLDKPNFNIIISLLKNRKKKKSTEATSYLVLLHYSGPPQASTLLHANIHHQILALQS